MSDDRPASDNGELTLDPVSDEARSRRRVLWAVLASIVLVTGGVVVLSRDDASPPRLPVTLGSGAGGEGTATSDMRVAWVTYRAGDGLPALGGEARAYQLEGSVDESAVRELARALAMSGDPIYEDRLWRVSSGDAMLEVYDESGGTWWYSSKAATVSSGEAVAGTGSAGCEPGPDGDCAISEPGEAGPPTTRPADECDPSGSTCATSQGSVECPPDAHCGDVIECPPDASCTVPPPRPVDVADLPSEAEARRIAIDLLSTTGMDLGGAKITVDGPYDAWYIGVEPRLDGLSVSGWMASVSVGPEGAVIHASGTLAHPASLGNYALIDTRAAIDRLNEQQLGIDRDPMPLDGTGAPTHETAVAIGDSGPRGVEECGVAPDGSEYCTVTDAPAVACPEPAPQPGQDPGTPPAPELMDGCWSSYPEPEPMEVVLTDAELVLILVPADDGSGVSYLVPGYRFSNADGAIVDVVAVEDATRTPARGSGHQRP